jgi:hypothetical protein
MGVGTSLRSSYLVSEGPAFAIAGAGIFVFERQVGDLSYSLGLLDGVLRKAALKLVPAERRQLWISSMLSTLDPSI